MIDIPIKVDSAIKTEAIERYDETVKAMNLDRLQYVHREIAQVIQILTVNKRSWTCQLGAVAEFLIRNVNFVDRGNFTKEGLLAAAALYYLCDTDDVIPDYEPGRGYLDDAIVLNESLKRLKRSNAFLKTKIEKEFL